MKLSYTNVKTFRECPKKYEYKYIQHLPEPEGEELKIGIAGHEALELYYRLDKDKRSQNSLKEIISKLSKVEDGIRQRVMESLVDYHVWAVKEDEGITITQTEQEINLKLGDYQFVGKIDAIGVKDNEPVLLEHKFKSQWGTDVMQQFSFDEQNKGYSLATGCRLIIYNLIRTKPAKTRPKFERVHVLVPESEILRFKEDLGVWNHKIETAKRDNEFPRNRGFMCKFCPYLAECHGLPSSLIGGSQ
jgi:PD-(D/E)XK nuclease superfamily